MNKSRILSNINLLLIKNYSTSVKPKFIANEAVIKCVEKEEYKPRKHPGIMKIPPVSLPPKFLEAVTNILEDYPVKPLITESETMSRHLKGRVSPMEQNDVANLRNGIYETILEKETAKVDGKVPEDKTKFNQSIKDKVINILKKKVYNWSPMTYNEHTSLVYMIARAAPEYAVLMKIFLEISKRDTKFVPRSLFDFGSGIGTVFWAANSYWKGNIFEFFNVDTSSFMNDLAILLLKGGRGTQNIPFKGVFHRQFFPANNTTYDLVVSAYSLLELPSFQNRMDIILRLWNKTEKYLILVEQGTNAGFKVINEARDFILQINDEHNKGHVFSPCPHDFQCPRFLENDNTPCNFQVAYMSLPLIGKNQLKRELYSYVVLKKGKRDEADLQWPRVVRETLVRSKHTICRMCTQHGNLQEIIFTACKHGKTTYHCARCTKWGDQLPISIIK